MATEISTPPGRIVWGHPMKPRTKTKQNSREPELDQNGQPRQVWSFGIAFDKATFQQHIWPALHAEAATAFPQGVPPAFAWKYVDGDGVDREGKPFNQREGYAGCYVLAVSTELMAPPLFKFVNGAYQQLPADAIKCGDWVSVGLDIKVNVPTDRTKTPGLYINPKALEHVGYGTEIVTTGSVDPNAIFKGQQHALPPGASVTPVGAPAGAPGMPGMTAPAPMGMPGAPAAPVPGFAPQPAPMGYPQPQAAPAGYPQPGQLPPPATDFIPGAPAPMAAPGYAPQPMQPQPGYPQPAPAGYAPQPGQMPGMPGPR